MALQVPPSLAFACRKTPERAAWLARLPDTLQNLERRWSLTLGSPFQTESTSAWVAPVGLANRAPVGLANSAPAGLADASAVLKLCMPHMEAEHEIQGLRFWDGDPTVRLLSADEELNAMLLERCEPGTALSTLPEASQDTVITSLLRRLWRPPSIPHPFRPLSAMINYWAQETLAGAESWRDAGLVREGLRLFEELPRTTTTQVLLATDLHAGNILQSEREPWLVIDPKPFIGDPAFDVTQHLFNCTARLRSDPTGMIRRIADLAGLDSERVRLWTFARAAAEPRDDWENDPRFALARAIAP